MPEAGCYANSNYALHSGWSVMHQGNENTRSFIRRDDVRMHKNPRPELLDFIKEVQLWTITFRWRCTVAASSNIGTLSLYVTHKNFRKANK